MALRERCFRRIGLRPGSAHPPHKPSRPSSFDRSFARPPKATAQVDSTVVMVSRMFKAWMDTMNKDGLFSVRASRRDVVPSSCGDDDQTVLVKDLRKLARLVKDTKKYLRPRSAASHHNQALRLCERPAHLQLSSGSRVVANFWERAMTVLGDLSRVLNHMSGGPQGQTLCARIAERQPDCWFCRLMSRIVEPNHCAIELANWARRGTLTEAEWRMDDQWSHDR